MARYSAERVSAFRAEENPIFQRHRAAYLHALELVDGATVLEVGCGDGYGSHILSGKAKHLTAVDRSTEIIRIAPEEYGASNIEFKVMEVPPLTFPAGSFEVAVAFQFIEHLAEPASFLHEIRNVLTDGGTLLLTTPNKAETIVENPYHLREFTADELLALVSSVFDDVCVMGVFGSERFHEYWKANKRWARGFMRFDFLRLSDHLPRRVRQLLFDHASRLTRTRLRQQDRALSDTIGPEDFTFKTVDLDRCLDFFVIARGRRAADT